VFESQSWLFKSSLLKNQVTAFFIMIKTPKFVCLAFLLFSLLLSCKTNSLSTQKPTFEDDITSYVNQMTTREKIGQIMLMNFRFWDATYTEGQTRTPLKPSNRKILNTISNYHIGNVILFSESLRDEKSAVLMISKFKAASKKIPLLVGIDQEGGTVSNLNFGTAFPSAMAIGKTGNSQNAYLTGKAIANEISAVGFNCDFAPVCDVNSNPANPVIGIRSYGDSPVIVSDFSLKMFEGLASGNIISTAKHFPGHGDTAVDSHHGLPRVSKSYNAWKKTDLPPFKNLIANNIPMIMSAHIQFPALDNSKILASKTHEYITRPATLSNKILTGILRNKLRFEGVIVTDALDMAAIRKNFTEEEAAIEAIHAGANLLCHPVNVYSESDLLKIENFFVVLENHFNADSSAMEILDESVCRVLTLKKNYGLFPVSKNGSGVSRKANGAGFGKNSRANAVNGTDVASHKNLAIEIERKALSSVELNWKPTKGETVLLITSYKENQFYYKEPLENLQKRTGAKIDFYSYEKEKTVSEELQTKIQNATYIILETTLTGYAVKNPNLWNSLCAKKIGSCILKNGKKEQTAVISCYLPYEEKILKSFNIYYVYNYKNNWRVFALEPIFGIKVR